MVMVEIDSNVILVKPITSRNNHKLAQAYRVLMTQLQQAGITKETHP
jgi:intergrase/recombinase